MKKYRPSTGSVIAGIVLMVIGFLCWVIRALIKQQRLDFLVPLGLVIVCIGGLTLTIVAFITLRKNDLAARKIIAERKAKEEAKKQAEERQNIRF